MITGPDLADLIALAGAGGGKVILAGDTGQPSRAETGSIPTAMLNAEPDVLAGGHRRVVGSRL
jgi:hypothetical protein